MLREDDDDQCEIVMNATKKDFRVEWFSGTGKGGQHRNRHPNCCRIIHLPTGLRAQSTRHRERPANQREAFNRLAGMLLAMDEKPKERQSSQEIVRTYHFERNQTLDHASDTTSQCPPSDEEFDEMVRARKFGDGVRMTGRM